MVLHGAKVADILRCHRQDATVVNDIENNLHSVSKCFGARTYHNSRTIIPIIANVWYYVFTSLGNIQTLGEEYTGVVRIGKDNKIPSKLIQTFWLVFYIGGESCLDRFLVESETKIEKSKSLTTEAKWRFLECIRFLKELKPTIKRVHQSLFYINGKYYNISNRLMGMRYVLLRQWLQDDSFTKPFKILGHLSLFYTLFLMIEKFLTSTYKNQPKYSPSQTTVSTRECILCSEKLISACATPCGHIYCWDCIFSSLSYQKLCPVCREVVNPNRIVLLQNYC